MNLTGKKKDIMPLKLFRLTIAESLLMKGKKPGRPINMQNKPKKIHRPIKNRPPTDVRVDNMGHLPDFTNQGRCRYCSNGKTTVICSKCNVRLCFVPSRNCFGLFHAEKK